MMLVGMCMFVRVLVRMFADDRVIVDMPMFTIVRVRMGVGVRMLMRNAGCMRMLVLFVAVRWFVSVRMRVCCGRRVGRKDVDFGSGDAAATDFAQLEPRTNV